ncbi:MAG TPA: type II toxin-antitoxin system ParD family antitoxin [Alphaproteobacteria bacterium]|nr:type II toxin-antitoxin system ParD family antitoxin [Alphaproteobacteria bacterium]
MATFIEAIGDQVTISTMNVSLPAEFVDFVEGEIASGEYGAAGMVVRDGHRRLRCA